MSKAKRELETLQKQVEQLQAGNAYKVVVRYGDGDNLVSYEENYAQAIGTLTGWRDDEVGTDFYEDHMEYLEKWSADPENDGKMLMDEIFSLLENDLMDTPMVGGVSITYIGEGEPVPAHLLVD